MEDIIRICDLTKDYGHHRGIFNIDIQVKKGEVFGLVGTNGSGKTTTIRNLMGFIKPTSGHCEILGLDCTKYPERMKQYVSYILGEIAFPDYPTGSDFLKVQAKYAGVTQFDYMNDLIQKLQLDIHANLKRMSKGMKQKTAIVVALMGNKDVLLLDEPTTGLDPLMREVFLDLIRKEKGKGKTIFMSSHIFEELEDVCDRVAMIKDGHIIDIVNLYDIRHWPIKTFMIKFADMNDIKAFRDEFNYVSSIKEDEVIVNFKIEQLVHFLKIIKHYHITSFKEKHMTLEKYFMNKYEGEYDE